MASAKSKEFMMVIVNVHKYLRKWLNPFLFSATLLAQTPSFEVASIKPNTAAVVRGMIVETFPGGRLTAEYSPVRFLIQQAYGVKAFQIFGGPEWMNSAHYDIEAE